MGSGDLGVAVEKLLGRGASDAGAVRVGHHQAILAQRLGQAGVKRLRVGGLALDYCVRASVLDALKEGFAVHLIADATRAVNIEPSDGDKALDEMREAGVIIEGTTP
ncbi:MAG: isochorismatase family protein [Planctomycetes bacterium]|nr:isochorismatase family protein [Planctomycetota bacterium]